VKPETALFLEKSHELLERADTMMGVGLTDDAGRAAYLAGLHSAQAFIFETTGRVFKRHSGVQREFSRLVKDDPRVDTGLRAFLSRTYQLKAIADYLTGPGSLSYFPLVIFQNPGFATLYQGSRAGPHVAFHCLPHLRDIRQIANRHRAQGAMRYSDPGIVPFGRLSQ
jgi:uncharacterized protein (UPF0332 family)